MTPFEQDNITAADDPSNFLGRDLAWLKFNRRVIAESEDLDLPLFDRMRFLGISSSNLDEFFMKRIALLQNRVDSGAEKRTHDGLTVRQQMQACREEVLGLQDRQASLWKKSILPTLESEKIMVSDWKSLDHEQRGRVDTWFHEMVFPILTPLAVDPGHPFPFISNLSLSLGVLLSEPGSSSRRFARVKVPDGLPGWIRVPSEGDVAGMDGPTPATVISTCDVIRHNLHEIFPGMEIHDSLLFRVTRGAGLEEDDEDIEDLMEFVQESLRHRRFAEAVRLETPRAFSEDIVSLLLEELELEAESHYARDGLLDYTSLNDICEIDRPDLRMPRWSPVTPPSLKDADADIFSVIREQDVLVHHPYESFDSSVERFIHAASVDPNVLAIKQCLYRTDIESSFIANLIRAADSGKQVSCIVELRARFDEDKNLQLTRLLEKHGIHVAYGILDLKTHAKTSLVVRREGSKLRAYGHIGTGNYHSGTARLYSDVGLLTARPEITGDLIELFNFLTGRSRYRDFKELLVAPITMRSTFYKLIDAEIEAAKKGQPSRIIAKMNQMEDVGIMSRLIQASQAGVQVDLSVRGFCCLKPGMPGLTENIRIVSIIGQFLEHSRIFHFANGQQDPLQGHWYIGSADWMKRNLDGRVEVVVPIEDMPSRRRLKRILDVNVADRQNAWTMHSDGVYTRIRPSDPTPNTPESDGTFLTLCNDAMETENKSRQPSSGRRSEPGGTAKAKTRRKKSGRGKKKSALAKKTTSGKARASKKPDSSGRASSAKKTAGKKVTTKKSNKKKSTE
ncbi:MAG: polyphosphate kinase 1 [Phycisphaerales bacterium]|nr:polyphosphate kinase 1 [Phycisphaerales bacterium]